MITVFVLRGNLRYNENRNIDWELKMVELKQKIGELEEKLKEKKIELTPFSLLYQPL